MGDADFQVAVVETDSEKKDQERKRIEHGKLIQMQKNWLEARKKIASLEAQVNMHRLREEALVCEMVELRKGREMDQAKFDEERREWLRSMRIAQESKAENVDKSKVEMDLLKAEIAELKSSLDDSERTRMFLLEDNGKIKQQKAKLRCDYNELKREHNKLLSSHEAGTVSKKSEVLSVRSGMENIPSKDNQNELRGVNNLGNAVLGLSKTCSVYISPVSLTQCDDSIVTGLEANTKRNEDSVAGSANMQTNIKMSGVNTEEKKLIEVLIEKLKQSDRKNQELRKALHTVDEQCEKLVRSFQELKLRYEEKERSLALNASVPGVVLQGRRLYLETGHSADDVRPASNAVKRKYASYLTAFGKRSKNDLC